MEDQVEQHRKWWQQIKQHRVAIGAVAIVLVVIIILIIIGYWFDWTGFNGYNKITVAHTISGTNAGTVTRTEEYQPGKGLWDWLQLLIIPLVLAVAGYVINLTISRGEQAATEQRAQSEREVAEKRANTEHEIALDKQHETALKEYIDKMSELILHEDLNGSDPKKEVSEIARIQTFTVLNRLDGNRKGWVLKFLCDAGLINRDNPVINLRDANLSGANLGEAFLNGAFLCMVDLSRANLSRAHLEYVPLSDYPDEELEDLEPANLSKANLSNANLSGANLERVDLSHANLIGANLSSTYLGEADLRFSNLAGADLTNSKLNLYGPGDSYGADLSYAKLKDVIGITFEELKEASSLKGATMPDGSKHP